MASLTLLKASSLQQNAKQLLIRFINFFQKTITLPANIDKPNLNLVVETDLLKHATSRKQPKGSIPDFDQTALYLQKNGVSSEVINSIIKNLQKQQQSFFGRLKNKLKNIFKDSPTRIVAWWLNLLYQNATINNNDYTTRISTVPDLRTIDPLELRMFAHFDLLANDEYFSKTQGFLQSHNFSKNIQDKIVAALQLALTKALDTDLLDNGATILLAASSIVSAGIALSNSKDTQTSAAYGSIAAIAGGAGLFKVASSINKVKRQLP